PASAPSGAEAEPEVSAASSCGGSSPQAASASTSTGMTRALILLRLFMPPKLIGGGPGGIRMRYRSVRLRPGVRQPRHDLPAALRARLGPQLPAHGLHPLTEPQEPHPGPGLGQFPARSPTV